jgi:hypothetical protein
MAMIPRTLIGIGVVLIVLGLAWPWLMRLGLGRLPGDILIEKGHTRFYFPLATSLVVSIVVSILVWLFKR